MRQISVLLFSAAMLAAQIGVPIPARFPPQLRQYLELTEAQVNSINQLNLSYARFVSDKARRSAQVQLEIAQETGRENLDANALGIRYLELEGIRREMAAEQRKTVEEIQKLLIAAQRVKLSTLQQALLLQSTACDAVSSNLMTPPGGGVPIASNRVGFPVLGGVGLLPTPQFTRATTCGSFGSFLLTGDFLPGPITTNPGQP